MHKSFESIQRAMRRDQPKTPEPMRGTIANTDQPRVSHSEYHNKTILIASFGVFFEDMYEPWNLAAFLGPVLRADEPFPTHLSCTKKWP